MDANNVQTSSSKIIKFLIQDMLDYSQINQGKFRQNIKEFDLEKSVREIMNMQIIKAEDKGIFLSCDLTEVSNKLIIHDESRIQQVLLNLQANAIKFTTEGSVTIKGQTYIEDNETWLQLSVIDTGIGIKAEDQGKLFKMFGYLQDDNQMNVHGIGLGLNISKKILEQFGGRIEVTSKEDVGTTFTFTIKLYEDAK